MLMMLDHGVPQMLAMADEAFDVGLDDAGAVQNKDTARPSYVANVLTKLRGFCLIDLSLGAAHVPVI